MGLTRDHRRSLLEQIDPGDWRLKAGLILTYSAEAAPLVAILSTLAGHSLSGEEAAEQGLQDGFRIMRDIEALSNRVRVLVNVGGLRTPGASGDRMAALLDMVVREVVPTKDGLPNPGCSFHPKLLIFEYEPKDGNRKAATSDVRMFVCTRNITTDDSVDTIASLRLIERKSITENGKRLCSFLQAALRETHEEIPTGVSSLLKYVEKVDLEPLQTASPIDAIEFFGQIPGQEPLSSLISRSADGVEERIVVSPFIDKTTLSSFLLGEQRKTSLLSERRDFAKICGLIEGDKFLKENFDCYEINRNGDQSFHSLHAKLVLDKTKSATAVTAGSANATLRAWTGANWEAVIRFRTSPGYYKKVFEDLFVDSEAENRAALCIPFLPAPEAPVDDPPKEVIANLISRAQLSYAISSPNDTSASVAVAITLGESDFDIKAISFRLLGEVEGHEASPEKQTWKVSWDVPIASFSSILSISVTFVSRDGEERIGVNRCLSVDPALLSRRNQGLLSELVQTQGIHQILSAILEGVDFGFSSHLGDGVGASWTWGDGPGLPVANLEALVFLCLKDDPESQAKRSMISDIMSAKFFEPPGGADSERIGRHRRLFESTKKLWMQLESEFPVEAS